VIPRIAVLDDEARMVAILEMLLRREGYEVQGFSDPEAAVTALAEQRADLLLTDLKMAGLDGLEVLERVRAADPELPVIVLTAHATVATALRALRLGAFDYVEKPFDNDALKALVRRALDHSRLARENRYLRAELRARQGDGAVIAESAALRGVLDRVRRAARSTATVLVTGESGTGKELVARAVHVQSDRVGAPFVAVNCRALAASLLESELFGHERGAFTGADRARSGLFERADGGTLFLDEIGDVSLEFQAKLLRVLQERRVTRVGGNEERAVDFRLVAASQRDLRREVDAGRFREDLYFRLAVIPIQIPPLRERREDVLPLARHFLARANADRSPPLAGWSPEVEAFLLRHAWPGNARELENAIERGAVLARGERIELDDLLAGDPSEAPAPPGDPEETLRVYLDRMSRERVREVLAACGGSKSEAARRLGVDRTTLYRLLERLGDGVE
jgi:two-component system, NtrC family, response regulator HydG